ncbi:hypothetical protein GUA87_09875 [Sneathiella sp. P13V-1]|uniref:HdaA/DnaA family protein n=1 Tax=Sneathiella sp. P13V-1 TaxID=2697366 RepID=UPI00187B38BC|nr:DnaA/Hda family protein [Sneathiella sp. P13V-1]MBE7637151.1 hypothetical protein [Sneathiella sp. P13V-1]
MMQIPFEFDTRAANGREDFLVSEPNAEAVAWIDRWPDWPGPYLLLVGPGQSGKSHLGQVWAKKSNAVTLQASDLQDLDITALNELTSQPLLLEDIGEGVDEQSLFHLYNLVKEKGSCVLMTSRTVVSEWELTLPDLKSRMGAVQVVRIGEPDDMLFSSVLLKHFMDKQLQVTPEVLQYLVSRLERSFEAASKTVDDIDLLSLAQKRNITIPLVRSILEKKEE